MGEIVNPYIAGAPVTEQRMFFGREDIFQWIETSIAGQYADHILVIHGQRRVGKTSVLKQLGNRLPKRYIPVFFDLQGRTHTTLDHFLWWLARETVRVLKQERNIEIAPPEKSAFSADSEFFENQFLAGLRPQLGSDTLLLTFDEFDNLEESEVKEELARPLIDHLRRLMGQPNLNFIFSIGSSGRKLENMQAAYTEFFKTALYKKISFLSDEQTHHLVTRPVEGVIEYERAAVERIYGITSGHPYFTQLTCHELFARCQRTEQRKIAKADVESVLDDVVERGTVNLKFVWDEATDIEKWSLAALAQLDKADNRALADFLRKNRVRFTDSDLTSGLLHLREKDVLTPQNRFVIHLMRLWLQKNRPMEQAREELTEANPIANRFIEIGLEFRDGGQYEKAIEYFRQALSVSADNLQAQVNLAITFMAQGQLEQAITEFEKALTIDDEDVASRAGLCDAHLKLGDISLSKGRSQEAIQSYQRVLGINTEHTEARQRVAEIHLQRARKAQTDGRDEEALNAFSEALKYTPEDPSLIGQFETFKAEKKARVIASLVARSEREAKALNWEAAVKILDEASALSPDDPEIQKRKAEALEKLRQKKLSDLKSRARAFATAEKFNEALQAWQDYLALTPDDAEQVESETAHIQKQQEIFDLYIRAGRALTARDFDEAIRLLKDVIIRDENYKDASRLLTKAIESRRTAPRQKQAKPKKETPKVQPVRERTFPKISIKRNWVIGGLLVILILGIGGGLFWLGKNDLLSVFPISTGNAGNTIIVTSAEDSGPGTLRQAILDAQTGDSIKFDTDVFPPDEPTTIFLSKAYENTCLPNISQGNITIDASNAGVILDGTNAQGGWVSGLEIRSNGNTIMGLQVVNFSGAGIALSTGNYNVIGGDATLMQGNIISKNGTGIGLWESSTSFNVIRGNRIYKNRENGITIETGPSKNTIGPDNVITDNGRHGIGMNGIPAHNNTVTANSIYDNSDQGIYYEGTGPTPPTILDVDLEVGTLNGQTCPDCVVEIFSTDTTDGKIYEGTVTADENGNFVFSKGGALSGPFLTATSRSPGNSTSAFSSPASALGMQTALNPIFAYIAKAEPDFEDDFSSDQWGDLAEGVSAKDLIGDGSLSLNLEAGTNTEKLVLQGNNIQAEEFALQLDFYFDGGSGSTNLNVGFPSLANGTNSDLIIKLEERSWAIGLGDYIKQSGEISQSLLGQRAHLQVIYSDSQMTAFLNGKYLGSAEGISHLGNEIWIVTAANEGQAKLRLDNLKFWDLKAFSPLIYDFTKPILDFTAKTPADFEEDFSTSKPYWYVTQVGNNTLENRVKEGVLPFSDKNGGEGFVIAELGQNFVLEFDYTLKSQDENSHIVVSYRLQGNESDVIKFNPNGFGLQGRNSSYPVTITQDQIYHFQILVLDDQLAVFINGKLIEYSDKPSQANGTGVAFGIYAETGFDASLDNIKFWNLETYKNTLPTPTDTASPVPVTQVSPKDGMVKIYIPAGEFPMGSDSGSNNEKPVHTVYLDAFWIDQTEVTNKMYSLCVSAGVCQPPKAPNSYSRTSYYGNPEFENYPVIYVDWDMANTYCTWAERRLPTEAEWEKAARGTTKSTYPWGEGADCDKTNSMGCKGETTAIGEFTLGMSPFGVLDMAGNVMEWVSDWYSATYYASSPRENPSGPSSGTAHVIRGGSWKSNENSIRSSYRFGLNPDMTNLYLIGFRCALNATSETGTSISTPPPTQTAATFGETILAFIQNREPDFQDDFSQTSKLWTFGSESNDGMSNMSFPAGQLNIIVGPYNLGWAHNSNLLSKNFALQVDAVYPNRTGSIMILFGKIPFTREEWTFHVNKFGQWKLVYSKNEETSVLASSLKTTSNSLDTATITILLRGKECAIYLNQSFVTYLTDDRFGMGNQIGLGVDNGDGPSMTSMQYNSIKFWNLDNINTLP